MTEKNERTQPAIEPEGAWRLPRSSDDEGDAEGHARFAGKATEDPTTPEAAFKRNSATDDAPGPDGGIRRGW